MKNCEAMAMMAKTMDALPKWFVEGLDKRAVAISTDGDVVAPALVKRGTFYWSILTMVSADAAGVMDLDDPLEIDAALQAISREAGHLFVARALVENAKALQEALRKSKGDKSLKRRREKA